MSVRVMSWVWDNSEASGNELLVLLAIADNADDSGGNAWPSMATLAKKCRLSVRTAQRATKSLEAQGMLGIAQNAGRSGTHRFRVLMACQPVTPVKKSPRQSVGGDSSVTGGVTPVTPGGDTGVTQTIQEPSLNHPEEHSSDLAIARPDVDRVCDHLADLIEANGSTRPTITKRWRDAARLLMDTDGKTEQQIHTAIDWCQGDEFWRTNILSMSKLREKYEQLRLQAARVKPSTTDARVHAALGLAEKYRQQEEANG